jgi:ABC-type uncharacterized transport system permease subunit
MVAIAHFIAISCYVGAAAVASVPFARRVQSPVRAVLAILTLGVVAHGAAFVMAARSAGRLPVSGLGPALSFAGLVLAICLLVAESVARDVTLAVVAAPFAALSTAIANFIGLAPFGGATDGGIWLVSHITLGFIGMAAFATAAAAGTIYLVERRELKSRRFAAVLRTFPPLETLDRVNHVSALAAWLALTLGIVLAATYSVAHHATNVPQIVWAAAAWCAVTTIAIGRVIGHWRAGRAALISSIAFACIVVLYVAVRLSGSAAGAFL